jgi:hypothetical protein
MMLPAVVPYFYLHKLEEHIVSCICMQVEQQTLGEIGSGAPGGSVLLYGRELLQQGLPCLLQPRLLESWGNGTNTEVRVKGTRTSERAEPRPVQLGFCQHLGGVSGTHMLTGGWYAMRCDAAYICIALHNAATAA